MVRQDWRRTRTPRSQSQPRAVQQADRSGSRMPLGQNQDLLDGSGWFSPNFWRYGFWNGLTLSQAGSGFSFRPEFGPQLAPASLPAGPAVRAGLSIPLSIPRDRFRPDDVSVVRIVRD